MTEHPNQNDLDVSSLPVVVFGHSNISWLGNILFMLIEGTMFALVIASYFYLRTRSFNWPPAGVTPPRLGPGLISAALLFFSIAPARWIQTQAVQRRKAGVQIGLAILLLLTAIAIVIRFFEFRALNCQWSDNAYASTLWVLLGMHAGHLFTALSETAVIGAIAFTGRLGGMQFVDAAINSDYWYFVVASGLAVDLIVYGTTHWF